MDGQTISISDLVAAIAKSQIVPPEKALWPIDSICEYLGVGKTTALTKCVCRPDFPRAIKIGDSKRWQAGEVMRWAERQR